MAIDEKELKKTIDNVSRDEIPAIMYEFYDTLNKINKFYNKEQFKDNLLRFYNNKYDFYPKTFGGKNV